MLRDYIARKMQDEKVIETSLHTLIGRVADTKASILNFMFKLEQQNLTWPQMLDNFAVLSGQINTLNKLLKNDRMPTLRNLCILPLMVSQERDEEMENMTENRIPVFTHEVVPDALRTKYEPEVEKEEERLTMQANTIPIQTAQTQVMALNDMITSLIDSIQTARDDWETESSIEQDDLAPSAKDTNILIAAITQGSGLRKRPEVTGSRSSNARSSSQRSSSRQ